MKKAGVPRLFRFGRRYGLFVPFHAGLGLILPELGVGFEKIRRVDRSRGEGLHGFVVQQFQHFALDVHVFGHGHHVEGARAGQVDVHDLLDLARLIRQHDQTVGKENAFIFGLSAEQVIQYENYGGYNPMDIFNNDQDIRRVLMQLINGYYSPQDPELFRDIYNYLLNTQSSDRADTYFILKDFRSYAEAHRKIDQAYRDEKWWARTAMLNTASAGKFSSDRTIEEYVRDIWHLKKIKVELK